MERELEFIHCQNCKELIPKTRKKGSIFCSPKCGWTYRNNKKALIRARLRAAEPALYKNYDIVKYLYRNNRCDISEETAQELGIDFNAHMGMVDLDNENGTTTFRLFEYTLTITPLKRIIIKKIGDECT